MLVLGERWEAVADPDDGLISEDTPIIVTASEGFILHVKRDPEFVKLLTGPEPPPPGGVAADHP